MNQDQKKTTDTIANSFGPTSLGDAEFAKMSIGFRRTVKAILKENGLDQNFLAQRLRKNESEISRWMAGMHNLTLRNMAKINAALPEPAIAFTRSIKAVPSEEDSIGRISEPTEAAVMIGPALAYSKYTKPSASTTTSGSNEFVDTFQELEAHSYYG